MSIENTRTVTIGEDSSMMICYVKTLRDAQFLATRLGLLPLSRQALIITTKTNHGGNRYVIHHGTLETPSTLCKTILVQDEKMSGITLKDFIGEVFTLGYDLKNMPALEAKQLEDEGFVPLFADGCGIDPRFE